jgi:hypothetical protein
MADDATVRAYRVQAEKGDATAQFNLGCAFSNGRGVEKDFAQALAWYRKAAAQGHSGAQNNLGWMYNGGHGVEKNAAEAAKWYLMAAKNGSAVAQNNIGLKYEKGAGVAQCRDEALRWYRAAADQGNESAQKNLERLHAAPASATPSPLSHESPRQLTRTRSRKAVVDHCQPLLEASTPTVYRHNAFRITGLAVDSTPREIKRRIDDLKAAHEMGDADEEHTHAFALAPPPTMEHIREAAQRLNDPERRIIEEFFWFWPDEWGDGKNDAGLRALLNGDKDTAFKKWMEALADHHGQASVIAKHNLAAMYQLVALDSEHYALTAELESDQHETISKYWRTCFRWWEELTEDEAFWSLVADRIRMLDDPRLTTGFVRRMRMTLPEAMDKINAMLAIAFIERGKHQLAEKHVEYMVETHQGQDDVAGTMVLVASPLLQRIKTAIEQADTAARSSASSAQHAAKNLLHVATQPIRILRKFFPPNDVALADTCNAVAYACLKCERAYARATEDWQTSIAILEEAKQMAISREAIEEVTEALRLAKQNGAFAQHGEPIAERLKELDAIPGHAKRFDIVQHEIMPRLEILRGKNATADAYKVCADMVAAFLRNLSVSAYNEASDITLAGRAIDLALGLATEAELRNRLKEDQAQLAKIERETHAHDLQADIRSDAIKITQAGVHYNNQQIAAEDLYGLRFGVFVQYTNGVRSSSSYRVDYLSRKGNAICIECKRMFRSESKAHEDFQALLDATLHQLAPGLVMRVARDIAAGRPFDMGSGCILTGKGVKFSTGALMWKTEHLVSYRDVRHGSHQGTLSLSSSRDSKAKIALSLRDNWNAVLFEHIAKAILEKS